MIDHVTLYAADRDASERAYTAVLRTDGNNVEAVFHDRA